MIIQISILEISTPNLQVRISGFSITINHYTIGKKWLRQFVPYSKSSNVNSGCWDIGIKQKWSHGKEGIVSSNFQNEYKWNLDIAENLKMTSSFLNWGHIELGLKLYAFATITAHFCLFQQQNQNRCSVRSWILFEFGHLVICPHFSEAQKSIARRQCFLFAILPYGLLFLNY